MEQITVRRMVIDCALPYDHPNPLAVRTRLDEASERLGTAMAGLLAPLADLGDEIIVIPRVELAFELDTSLEPDELARRWAARFAAAIAARLRRETRATLLRFPDESHYLARFLVDSATGHAQAKWYYQRWHGLAALPTDAALRTALVEDPARGVSALAALTPSELSTVVVALGAREARRVVEIVVAARTTGDVDRAGQSLAASVAAWLPAATACASPWQAALVLAAMAASPAREDVPAVVALAAALAARVHARLHAGDEAAPAPLDVAGPPGPSPLLALAESTRRALLASLAPLEDSAAPGAPVVETRYTRLGGLLLLLPRIAELPLDDVFGDDAPNARLFVLAAAAGHAHRDEVLNDPLWRDLCGVDLELDLDSWRRTAPIADRLGTALWERAYAHADRVVAIATRHVAPLLVLAGDPGGAWLGVTPLTRELRATLRHAPVADIDGLELAATVSLATGRAAARMLAWLAPDLADANDVALALAAQHVLRAFARRLPGFAASTPRFLYDSFLDFDATVLEIDTVFHCRVGRPRLAALFGLTGALRGRLPIGDGRVLELVPE